MWAEYQEGGCPPMTPSLGVGRVWGRGHAQAGMLKQEERGRGRMEDTAHRIEVGKYKS